MDKYSIINVMTSDMCGIPRGRFVTGKHAEYVFKKGLGFAEPFFTFGAQNELPDCAKSMFGNGNLIPDPATLQPAPWRSDDPHDTKWGEVVADFYAKDGNSPAYLPRTMAKQQLQRLGNLGYSFYYTTEFEFFLAKKDTYELTPSEFHIYSPTVLSDYSEFIADAYEKLDAAGIELQSFQHEIGPGQFEFNLKPQFGITGADHAFRFRVALKQIARHHGFDVTFMTYPHQQSFQFPAAGAHFNHSLWRDNVNVMEIEKHNASDGDCKRPNEVLRHWVGGLCRHAAELNVLTSPSRNCYRRLHGMGTPGAVNWAVDNRMAAFRVVRTGDKVGAAYVESRMPSSAANPYLTLAATLAAGIDGLEKRIEPPAEIEKFATIATEFEAGLAALRESEFANKVFGAEFVEYFCEAKLVELKTVKTKTEKYQKVNNMDEEAAGFAAERDEYFRIM